MAWGIGLVIAIVTIAAGRNYAGSMWIYLMFSLLVNLLLANGFRQRALYFDTFIGIFLWLGFWLKLTAKLLLHEAGFQDALSFDRTPAAYDHALIVSCVGFAGFMVATSLRKRFFAYPGTPSTCKTSDLFQVYSRYRKYAIGAFLMLVVGVAVTNAWLGVYQRGMIARTMLPLGLGGIYSWLLQFGLTSIATLIVRFEMEIRQDLSLPAIAAALIEPFLSNVSLLSRGMVVSVAALACGVWRHTMALKFRMPFSRLLAIGVAFLILFAASVVTVNALRARTYASLGDLNSLNLGDLNSLKVLKEHAESVQHMTTPLFIERWVGIEGVVAVSSSNKLGWDLWSRAWKERIQYGVRSIYDNEFIDTPYTENRSGEGLHFVSLPGAIAFLFYPGSLLFLFAATMSCGIVGATLEVGAYRYGGGNWIFCALVGEVVAYRFAHFGYVPAQSYLLFGAVAFNIALFFFAEKLTGIALKLGKHGDA